MTPSGRAASGKGCSTTASRSASSRGAGPAVGIHARGPGPGDTASLPYFAVADMALALERVRGLGGSVIHAGEAWSVCRDSEGTPFGLAVSGD
jgi:predicted enzyme related to lactoylglutathione lyase